jgi:tRNA-splicing ligase RtcB
MSRHQAMRTWHGSRLVKSLARQGIVIRGHSARGIAEEAPAAYKDVDAVVQAAHDAGISRKVARLEPLICIKG